MNVSGISNSSDYQHVYDGRSKERTSAPVSFGYGEDSYTSSVAASYIEKQKAQRQQMEREAQKKEQWKQFGWDILKGLTIGGILLGGYKLFCSNSSGEMQKQTKRSLRSTEGVTLKHAATTGDVNVVTCQEKLKELNLNKQQVDYIFNNICIANDKIKKGRYIEGVNIVGNRGAILFGRPGVGKSYAMEQIAKACDASYVSIKGSDFMNKYQGESEGNLQGLMEEVREKAIENPDKPVIIFMDEGESILGSGRTQGDNNTNAMLRSIFLGAMETEGTDALPSNVKFIVTSNFAEDIDEAYRRDGRLGIPMELQGPNVTKQAEIMQKKFQEKLDSKLYDQYKNVINDYINNRKKHMENHTEDKKTKDLKDAITIYEQNLKYAENQLTENKYKYYKALASGDSGKNYLTNIETYKDKIKDCQDLIEEVNQFIQIGDLNDSRYFNFTPAEIKGLVEDIVGRLFIPGNELNINVDEMVKIEEQHVATCRNDIKQQQEKQKNKKKVIQSLI